jgi:hypothetical protein
MTNGGLALLISVVQVVFGVLGKNQLPRWAPIASVALFLGEGIQMASGRLHLFALHVPLGLALFARLAPLVWWITTGRSVPIAENASEKVGVRAPSVGWPIGGK